MEKDLNGLLECLPAMAGTEAHAVQALWQLADLHARGAGVDAMGVAELRAVEVAGLVGRVQATKASLSRSTS